MIFRDRFHAGEQLSERLGVYRGMRPLVLAIPRGAVPMAGMIASKLQGDLDVVLVRKIGAPDNPEYAIGSVSEFGTIYESEGAAYYGLSHEEIEELAELELRKLRSRRRAYTPIREPASPEGRVVIIVDDGIATGSTMVAAVRAVRSRNPEKIVVAAPVASASAVELLTREADELVILDVPMTFFSISQFYEDFSQVSDQEVIELLQNRAAA